VDLNEAAQRILRRHWVLIVLVTLIGVAVPAALIRAQEDSYLATARIVIGATDTRDGQEATALADAALALATSREVIDRVLTDKGVVRDPSTVAEEVRVEPIGTSGVLEVSVTDADRTASAVIVNGLAAEIVRMRDEAVFASTKQALTATDQQIAAVAERIRAIEDAARDTVASFGNVDALALEHAQVMEERSSLDAQRQQLLQALTAAVPPRVVDASAAAGDLVPAALTTRLAIGAVLGIVLGVALAATRESLRPTLSGPMIARHLGAPLLARLRRAPRADTGVSDPWLPNYLMLAADAAGVGSVELVPVGRHVDVSGLARDLGDREGGPRVVPLVLDPEGPHENKDRPRLSGERVGIVAVTPDVVKGTAMFADLERHSELARRPIIGVITYRGRAGSRRSAPRATVRHSATTEPVERTVAGSGS
jgi:capsular polysaccharide biosynthesis protein